MSDSKTIAQNATWLMLATTGQKLIAFLTFAIAARFVGAAVTGEYFFSVSVTSIFVILTDLGMTPVVIRHMAQNPDDGRAALATAVRLKLAFIPLAIAASLVYGFSAHVSLATLGDIALACLVMSADATSLLWYGLIRGKQLLRYEAIGMFTGQVLTAIVSLGSIAFHAGAPGLILGLLTGSSWNVLWSVYQAHRLKLWQTTTAHWQVPRLIRETWPFALAGIFVKVYSYIDTLMLHAYHGAVVVGQYAVAYKMTYATQFLPLAFVAALYPGMAAVYASGNHKELQKIFSGSLRLMMMVSVPLSAGLSALAPRLIPLVYGKGYNGSIAPLMILPWVLVPIFLDFPTGSLLNATHRARQKTAAMGVACAVNVVANILLTPRLGLIGAAWAGVCTFWVMGAAGLVFAWNDLPGIRWVFTFALRGLCAALLMWFATHLLVMHLHSSPLLFLATALIGCLSVYVTRLFTHEDALTVRRWMKRTKVIQA